jgi:hypothetical protein
MDGTRRLRDDPDLPLYKPRAEAAKRLAQAFDTIPSQLAALVGDNRADRL